MGYSRLTAEESTDLGEDQRLVAVRRGDFVNEVSVSGSLEYKDRDSLSFGTAGTVAEVAVEAGQRVRAGDVLARLDSETIAELERAAVQAEGKLRDAEDSLAEARHPYSALDLARAQADVADALIAKRSAEDELAEMQTSDAQAVARAGAAVADALIAKASRRGRACGASDGRSAGYRQGQDRRFRCTHNQESRGGCPGGVDSLCPADGRSRERSCHGRRGRAER